MRKNLLIAALIFTVGLVSGLALRGHWISSNQVQVAQAEKRAVQVDAVTAVADAQTKDEALGKRQDAIQTQTRTTIAKVKHYAKRPANPVPADPQPAICWGDLPLSAGTVSVLNAHRAGLPLDSAALPGDAEGQAASPVTADDLFEASAADAGQYRELAAAHDELVDYVLELQRKQRAALANE